MSDTPILDVRGLVTEFRSKRGVVRAVENVSFRVPRGGAVGIVGESGSGKSVTALSILRLLAEPAGHIASGEILFEGTELTRLPRAQMEALRGQSIAMVFQEPMTSLNPVFRIGDQIAESVLLHRNVGQAAARARAIDMLRLVGIPDPERRVDDYPHQMSGGMRQRVMIAIALACDPKLLIADEPTTALDVTIQAQILDLLRRLREQLGTAIMLITHDLGVVAEFVDEVVVMYAGRVVERADTASLFRAPQHPYTAGLLRSIPRMTDTAPRLSQIRGSVPSPTAFPPGCRFHPRCDEAQAICQRLVPPEFPITPGHAAACWKHSGFQPVTSP
jgi:peptide/nickel transport system ATP-binding protein/oligopeptide transport system ATP-binding protein